MHQCIHKYIHIHTCMYVSLCVCVCVNLYNETARTKEDGAKTSTEQTCQKMKFDLMV